MANPERGEFEVKVKDKTYTLTLKTAGLMALQQHFSTPDKLADLSEIFQRVMNDSIEHQVAMVWACLRKYHPEVTFTDAVDWIDDAEGLQALTTHIDSLSAASQPDPADLAELSTGGGESRPRKARAKRGTGVNGTSSLAASA
jgi:hypothetical protein